MTKFKKFTYWVDSDDGAVDRDIDWEYITSISKNGLTVQHAGNHTNNYTKKGWQNWANKYAKQIYPTFVGFKE